MPESPAVDDLATACRAAGGRAWLVGGSVRDGLLGRAVKDIDVEVHHLQPARLERLLRSLGHVNQVGRSFGVFKLTVSPGSGLPTVTIDVSIPRRDSNAGVGHRGILVAGDPDMGPTQAARRRDLTINAMMMDPLTGELLDPFDGQVDLAARRLRAVDATTFLDDPLRALRVVQFAGRFDFQPDEELLALCRRAPLGELPAERVLAELEKLLLGSQRPSVGLEVARKCDVLARILPELAGASAAAEQAALDAALDQAVDRAAQVRNQVGAGPRDLALMLAVLLHNVEPQARLGVLERLRVHSRQRYPLQARVLGATAGWSQLAEPCDDTTLRTLAETDQLTLLCHVAWAVTARDDCLDALGRAELLGIATAPLPVLVRGRDLRHLGVQPGPAMGRLLDDLRRAQLAGVLVSQQELLDHARVLVRDAAATSQEPA